MSNGSRKYFGYLLIYFDGFFLCILKLLVSLIFLVGGPFSERFTIYAMDLINEVISWQQMQTLLIRQVAHHIHVCNCIADKILYSEAFILQHERSFDIVLIQNLYYNLNY
jgi:hypothetical protein